MKNLFKCFGGTRREPPDKKNAPIMMPYNEAPNVSLTYFIEFKL